MGAQNLFLDRSSDFVGAAAKLDEVTEKAVKDLKKSIENARNTERLAIEVLTGLVDAHQAIPLTTLIDGSESNDPSRIRTDINVRTTMLVNNAEAKIKELYKQAHGTPSEQVAQKAVDIAAKTGTQIGKALNAPTQAVKGLWDGIKTNANAQISTTSSKAAQVLGLGK